MEKQITDFTVFIEQDEDGVYVAKVPEIEGCYTQGKTLQEALERIKEAIELCLEEQEDINLETNFVGFQKIEVPRKNVQVATN